MNKKYSIGADIGGSHITSAVIDLNKRKIVRDSIIEIPVDNKAEGSIIISQWSKAIGESISMVGEKNIKGVGFAMPGPFDYPGGICLIKGVPKYEKLYGINIGASVRKELKLGDDVFFRFINDASSFAVGEAWAGKASRANRSMAITLGTGFGSAFISNKAPVVRGDDVPELGCVYHIKYRNGIADDYFSTRWFTSGYESLCGIKAAGVKDVAKAARTNDSVRDLFREFGSSLGLFLAPWLNKFGAEILVIGGNISRAYDLFGESLRSGLKKNNCKTEVAISELKEDAALMGSAYLLDDEFWHSVKDLLRFM